MTAEGYGSDMTAEGYGSDMTGLFWDVLVQYC